jgi:hypothetical protein
MTSLKLCALPPTFLGNLGSQTRVPEGVHVKRPDLLLPLLGLAAGMLFAQDTPKTEPAPASTTQVAPHTEALASVPVPAPATLSNEQIGNLIRDVAEKDIENDKRQRDYTYIERVEEHKLNGKGEVASTEIRTYDVLQIYDEQCRRMTSKDDKPLSPKDAAKEEEKIQKIIDKRRNESDSQREKRLKEEEKDREETRLFVKEVADAYNFTLAGVESLEGRETYVIDAEPRPGFEAKRKEAKILPKFRFRVWIDRAENQWVKLDAQCIDTVTFGLFLARIHKGSRIVIDTTRINDEVWLPRHVAVHVDVRLALLKNFNVEQDVTYKDYKKFHTQTKIVGMEEVK